MTEEDIHLASEAACRLSAGEALMPLSPSLTRILSRVLTTLAKGEIAHPKTNLSTTTAAEYLEVSRPCLVRLLAEGKIPYHMVGAHRRVYIKDLKAFKSRLDDESYATLAELRAHTQDLKTQHEEANQN